MKQYTIVRNEDGALGLQLVNQFDTHIYEQEFEFPDMMTECFPLLSYPVEHAFVVGTDIYNRPIAVMEISIGDYHHCDMNKNLIAQFLLLSGSRHFYLFHNHPDCRDAYPSGDDATLPMLFDVIGHLIDCEFKGSFVLASDNWSVHHSTQLYSYM